MDVIGQVPVVGIVVVALTLQGNAALQQIALGNVQSDELDVGVVAGDLGNGAAEGVAGHYDDIVALSDGQLHGCHTAGGIVGSGLVVLDFNVVVLAELHAGFPGGLVEGLVGDITVVRDHGNLVTVSLGSLSATGGQGHDHDQSQQQSQNLLHDFIPP